MDLKKILLRLRGKVEDAKKEQQKQEDKGWEKFHYDEEEIKSFLEQEEQESRGLCPADQALYDAIFPKTAIAADLDQKVDEFIDWYFKNIIKDCYTDVGEYNIPRKMRNFIEKMAVWYELRYPDYEVARIMPYGEFEEKDINKIMFQDNPYVQTLLDEDSDTRQLDWDEFFNVKAFLASLPYQEKYFFMKPHYREIIYFKQEYSIAHLHVTKNGIVEMAEGITELTGKRIYDDDLVGMSVKQVVALFKEKCIAMPKENGFDQAIKTVEIYKQCKEGMLDCVMYRIIERGGNRIGPRRAFLFAKEFRRNIDIPMMYAADTSDPNLREFINEYLKAGGYTDLTCYENYFCRASKWDQVSKITVAELLSIKQEYTEEEQELHERLVNVLASRINQTELQHEEVMRLRLKRRLEKSKKESDL